MPEWTALLLRSQSSPWSFSNRKSIFLILELGQVEPDLSIERQTLEQAFRQLRNPPALTSIIAYATQRGHDMAVLAEELEFGTGVLIQLKRRKIISESLPEQLLEGLGDLLAVSMQ